MGGAKLIIAKPVARHINKHSPDSWEKNMLSVWWGPEQTERTSLEMFRMWQIPHAQASSSLFERVHARKLKYGDTNAHKTCRMNFVHKKELLFTGFHVTNGTKGSVSKVHRRWGISVCSRSMFLSMKKQRIVSKKCLFVTLRFSPLKIFSLFEPENRYGRSPPCLQ